MFSRIEEYSFYKRIIDKYSVKQNERGGQLEECALIMIRTLLLNHWFLTLIIIIILVELLIADSKEISLEIV